MIKPAASAIAFLLLGFSLAGCNPPPATEAPTTGAGTGSGTGTSTAAGSMSDPKSSMSYQLDLLKAGDTEKLKECFTERLRADITPELVAKGKAEGEGATIDKIYASAEMGEEGGKKTAKVKMESGRTLTTLVETDGKWLSDTIWFK